MPLVAQLLAREEGLSWKMPPQSKAAALAEFEQIRKLFFEMADAPAIWPEAEMEA
jgi:hypothetical protein